MTKPYRPVRSAAATSSSACIGSSRADPRSVDEPRHRSGPLLHERPAAALRSWRTAASSRGTTAARTPTRSRRSSSTRTFLASYSTSFGNDSDSFSRIMGKKAHAGQHRRRGQPAMEGGRGEGQPRGQPRPSSAPSAGSHLPGDDKPGPINIGDEDLSHLIELVRVPAQPEPADRTPRSTTGFCTRSRASWRRSRTGRASGCITMRAERITDSAPQT